MDSAKSHNVDKDTTVAALKIQPLALRLTLTVGNKARDIALLVLAVSGSSDKLNEGTTGCGPDDVHHQGWVSLTTQLNFNLLLENYLNLAPPTDSSKSMDIFFSLLPPTILSENSKPLASVKLWPIYIIPTSFIG